MKAAVELGYVPESALDSFRAPRPARLVLLLPAGGNQFFGNWFKRAERGRANSLMNAGGFAASAIPVTGMTWRP